MNSMTGFSRVQLANQTFCLTWEIKSVNHRFLDQFYRLPESWRFIEPQLRQIINRLLSRGRVEVALQVKQQNSSLPQVNINLLSQLVDLSKSIANEYHIQDDLSTSHCLTLPMIWSNSDNILTEEHAQWALSGFEQALNQLCEHRHQEGTTITQLLSARVEKLKDHVQFIRQLTESSSVTLKEKFQQKISALYTGQFDEQRLEQELICYVMKLDIAEELDRLTTHLSEIQRVLLQKGANGRRLDFLVQECHRETNTIGSKTDSAQISQIAIDMKVLIEQMREQIQNVE